MVENIDIDMYQNALVFGDTCLKANDSARVISGWPLFLVIIYP